MSYLLPDGRLLMASLDDIDRFFKLNNIIGKTIVGIRPFLLDYMIRNLEDIENINTISTDSAICTDGQICIFFNTGDHVEIEIPGDAPFILGYNSAKLSDYPSHNGCCYTLQTMFQKCLGRHITDIVFHTTSLPMFFSSYRGIDMSNDDNGIKALKLILDDGSYLLAKGAIDYFDFSHCYSNGEPVQVPFSCLLDELNEETKKKIFKS